MRAIKVPYLKHSELDHAAAELLRKYSEWKGSPARPPIDVDEIVEGYLGLDFEVANLREYLGMPDVLGATWLEDGVVRVDESLEGKDGRFAFTVAHEIGHWVLHRPVIEMEKVTLPLFSSKPDAEPKPAIVCRAQARKQPAEWQADQFAARVLMPASDVRAVAHALHGDGPLELAGLDAGREARLLIPELRSAADGIIADGNFNNVSNEAMCYRLLDLGLVADINRPQRSLF
ncbi:MAG: ImmA/IrrE family metallo-endopeptidase [Deltaproteobacteria bacterium]|nr:MAG: ImmA/IrrE family metallo-endopeptidase [Deltaproteobacteria bacterium]